MAPADWASFLAIGMITRNLARGVENCLALERSDEVFGMRVRMNSPGEHLPDQGGHDQYRNSDLTPARCHKQGSPELSECTLNTIE